MCGTGSDQLFKRLKDENERNALSVYVEAAVDKRLEMELGVERDELVLRLNSFKMSRDNLKRKLSEREFNLKVVTALVKYLEMKVRLRKDNNRMLQKNAELIKKYSDQKALVREKVGKLVKNGPM